MISKLLLFVILLLSSIAPIRAQERLCNPFTTTPEPGMLALGTHVQLQRDGQMRSGVIVGYYLQSCFLGAPIIGQDPQAYVVNYGNPTGEQTVLNASQFSVLDAVNPCQPPICNLYCITLPHGLACPMRTLP